MEESTLIKQKCIFIRDFDKSVTEDQLKSCLDVIVNELNKSKALSNAEIIQQIVLALSFRFTHDRIFSNANLLDHQLLVIIRTYYFNLICQWRSDQLIDPCLCQVFIQIAILFSDFYKRCKAHWDFMFQTFKSEIAADGQQKLPTIYIYIRFLDQIEKYIPITYNDNQQSSSRSFSLCILL